MSIQAIDRASVHRLTSGQVVIDLQTAVKELLENALDADATSIVIIFRDHGVDSFEVQDNGRGIEESDWPGIALKHHTSKLASYSDLTAVSTLGFRGEALSSLCGTAALSIATATAATAPAGTQLTFKPSGECVIGPKLARGQGTTVVVKELFKALPVRRKELAKNAKREFGKAIDLIQAYALIRTGTRFEVKNIVKGKSSMHLQIAPNPTVRANFSALFSAKSLSTMMDLDLSLEVAADKTVLRWTEDGEAGTNRVVVKGLISKPIVGSGRTSGNRQFYYINGRPFSPAKISKAFNEVYKTFLANSFPAVVADFQLSPDAYDVNVSPDKRTIFLHSEGNLITALKSALENLFQPSRSTYPIGPEISGPSPRTESQAEDASLGPTLKSRPVSQRAVSPQIEDGRHESHADSSPPPAKRRRVEVALRSPSPQTSPLLHDKGNTATLSPMNSAQGSEKGTPASSRSESSSPVRSALNSQSLPGRSRRSTSRSRSPPPAAPNQVFRQQTLHVTRASWSLESTENTPDTSEKRSLSKGQSAPIAAKRSIVGQENLNDGSVMPAEILPPSVVEKTSLGTSPIETPGDEETLDVITIDDDRTMSSDEEVEILACPKSDFDIGKISVLQNEDAERAQNLASLDENDDRMLIEPSALYKESHGIRTLADITLEVDLSRLTAAWTSTFTCEIKTPSAEAETSGNAKDVCDAGLNEDAQAAEAALARVVSKADFEAMSVIGQFNHAFIIARRKTASDARVDKQDDLFIVDQHASDEKWNFEELQASTVIQSQRLLQPRSLNLSAQDEMVAIDHAPLLRMNGFDISIDEDAEMGHRVKLLSHPVSKDIKFGVDDLEELISLAEASSVGEIVRPSRIRRMFASRACRKSVMFGKALNNNQMTNILRHMGQMEQPWSCPHGRPTMRWLSELNQRQLSHRQDDIADLIKSIT